MAGPRPGKTTGTAVNVPGRVQFTRDPDDLGRMSGLLEERTGAQLERAIDTLEVRGGGGDWDPEVTIPEVTFSGAAQRWSVEKKRQAQAAVDDAVVKGAERARAKVGGGGKTKATPKPKKKKADPKLVLRPINTWAEFSGADEDFYTAATNAIGTWMLLREMYGTMREPYALMFRLRNAPLQLWVIDHGEIAVRRSLLTPNWEKLSEPKPIELAVDATGMQLVLEPDGLRLWREGALQNAINAIAKETEAGKNPVSVQADTAAPQAEITEKAKQRIAAHTSGWETSMKVYYRLSLHGGAGGIHPFSHALSPKMPVVPTIPIVPIVDMVPAGDGDGEGKAGQDDKDEDGGGGQGGGSGGDRGAGAGGSGSDVTAAPGQNVGAGGTGIVIAETYGKAGGSKFPMLPPDPNAKDHTLPCKPYGEELPVALLGDDAIRWMRPLIEEIAKRLDMAPCEYPANFCLQAARMIRIRTSQVQTRFEIDQDGKFSTELVIGGTDEQGNFAFVPHPSVAVQYLQHLAATVPLIRNLMELVRRLSYPKGRFGPHYWFRDVMDEGHQGCGLIWLSANQIMMQQLLNSSAHAVKQRHNNPEYTKVFAVLCKTHLAEQVETIMLRTVLEKFIAAAGTTATADGHDKFRNRQFAQMYAETVLRGSVDQRKAKIMLLHGHDASLATRLFEETEYVFRRGAEAGHLDAGDIRATVDNKWAIRASDGALYGMEELDKLIQIRQQVLTSIDPMLNQLKHKLVTAIRPLVEDPELIPGFLDKLFTEMLAKNASVQAKNRADYEYAFEHAQIHRVDADTPPAVLLAPTTVKRWTLTGIHALAHTTVGVHFKGDAFYENALDRLVGQEYYWRSFAEDMIFIFGIAFTVICPPLGAALSFAANLALGIEKYGHAKEQEEIYESLINPEQVLDYAEIQIDLFVAKLQIGLSFLELLPGAGKGVKALTGLGKRALTKTAVRGARQLAKEVVMAELQRIAKMSAESFAKALVLELAEEAIEDKVVGALLGPIIDAQIKQLEAELRAEGLLR